MAEATLPAEADAAPARGGLIRAFRRWELVALVLNAIIGAGIFGLPARVYAIAGTWSLAAFVLCGALAALILLCFAEVSSRYDVTGGPYLYARKAFGAAAGFQMGWLLWLARLTAFASLCNLWVDYLGFFWPGAVEARALVITGVIAALTLLNVLGVRHSARVTNFFTVGKLLPLLLFIALGLFAIEPSRFEFGPLPTLDAFSGAVLLLVFAFSGFEMAVIPSGEARDPRRHAPFALLTGIAIVAAIYISIQIVCIGTLPDLAGSARPLADAAAGFTGGWGAALIAAGALVSVTGTLNVIVMVTPRLPYAMAEQGQLPRIFAATHARFRTPWLAILLSSATALVLTLQGSFVGSLTISTVIRLITYAATCVALPVLRRRPDAPPAAFTAPAGMAVTVAAVALCAWLVSSSGASDLKLTGIAAVAGVVLWLALGRGRAPLVGASS